jgi:hypothetical protein
VGGTIYAASPPFPHFTSAHLVTSQRSRGSRIVPTEHQQGHSISRVPGQGVGNDLRPSAGWSALAGQAGHQLAQIILTEGVVVIVI